MGNIVNAAKLNRAIEMAQDYLWSDLEEGTNSTTLYDCDNKIEVDVEVYCSRNISYDKGTYLIPPSCSGKITNEPISIIAWFFDENYDNPTDRDITKRLTTYKYSA